MHAHFWRTRLWSQSIHQKIDFSRRFSAVETHPSSGSDFPEVYLTLSLRKKKPLSSHFGLLAFSSLCLDFLVHGLRGSSDRSSSVRRARSWFLKRPWLLPVLPVATPSFRRVIVFANPFSRRDSFPVARYVGTVVNYVKYLLQCLQRRGFDKMHADDQTLDLATPTSEVSSSNEGKKIESLSSSPQNHVPLNLLCENFE